MKTGLKTSEFYVTLVSMLVSLLVMTGVLEPDKASEISELIVQAIGGIVALGTVIGYLLSRTELKKEEMRLQAKG
jgi:NhaP-type Na+/H+ or K+/H+ antiporter